MRLHHFRLQQSKTQPVYNCEVDPKGLIQPCEKNLAETHRMKHATQYVAVDANVINLRSTEKRCRVRESFRMG